MNRRVYIAVTGFALLSSIGFSFIKGNTPLTPLDEIHQEITDEFPEMPHISRADLERQLTSDNLVILDTRPMSEYLVSHISGALQVNPEMSAEEFQAKFAGSLKNKTIVVYCSVGHRSTIFGHRLQNEAIAEGAKKIQNLEGGLFGWHNDGRPLVNASGATSGIHPYNTFWGRLIETKDDIRYQP